MDGSTGDRLDLLLVNPSGRDQIYQELGSELTTASMVPAHCGLRAGPWLFGADY
jgi:hypothetical protein